jgi:hypothetical protein
VQPAAWPDASLSSAHAVAGAYLSIHGSTGRCGWAAPVTVSFPWKCDCGTVFVYSGMLPRRSMHAADEAMPCELVVISSAASRHAS